MRIRNSDRSKRREKKRIRELINLDSYTSSMYWAYTRHNILPSVYASVGINEQLIIETFNEQEEEDIRNALGGDD